MADAPFADYQTVMGYQGLVGPNPYLTYQGAIPMPGYRGTPTDASGRPIQSYLDAQKAHDAWSAANPAPAQGTTLNTNPNDMMTMRNAALTGQPGAAKAYGANFAPAGAPGGIQQLYGQNFAAFTPQQNWTGNTQQAAPAPAPQNPIDMRQAYLDALANPGKVTTPGAQIYPGAAPTGAPQPSVLDKFLANNQASTGAGGYTNQPFFATLNALKNVGGQT